MSSLSEFFDALWSAIDGQALSTLSSERARSTEAFLGAWGECLVWTARKLLKGFDGAQTVTTDGGVSGHLADDTPSDAESPKEVSRALFKLQFGKLVGELGNALRVQANAAGVQVSAIYEKLERFAPGLCRLKSCQGANLTLHVIQIWWTRPGCTFRITQGLQFLVLAMKRNSSMLCLSSRPCTNICTRTRPNVD